MWEFLGNVVPVDIWKAIGAVVTAGVASWLGYRLGRRATNRTEYRQVLRELLDAYTDLIWLEPADHDSEEWKERLFTVLSRIDKLMIQIPNSDMRLKIEAYAMLLSYKFEELRATPNGSLLQKYDEVSFRGKIHLEMRAAIGRELRGESMRRPSQLELLGWAVCSDMQLTEEDIAEIERNFD